jgi:hypothetical protein
VGESIHGADAVHVSAVSMGKTCTKIGIGKLDASLDALVRGIEASGFVAWPPIHRDPGDRLLVAQAIVESWRLVTADAHLGRYSDRVTVIAG